MVKESLLFSNDGTVTIFNSYKANLLLLFFFVIFVYVVIFSLLNTVSNNVPMARPWIFIIEIILWIILIFIIIVNVKTIKSGSTDFTQELLNLFGVGDPEINVKVDSDTEPKEKTKIVEKVVEKIVKSDCSNNIIKGEDGYEVFHIPNNDYTFDDADEVCNLYNSRLATYDEIERAYNNGASWCSYGWSADQLALYPTQKEIYNELKQIPGHGNDCGRPGINGGYMPDRSLKFGVNCYGLKPYITNKDKKYIKDHTYSPINDLKKKEEELKKEQINNILIAPFNKTKWNEFNK
jgi:hypothetical protein